MALLPAFGLAQPFDREAYALKDQTTEFMLSIAPDLLKLSNDEAGTETDIFNDRADRLAKLPVFRKINEFFEANHNKYDRIRKRGFKELIPPPAGLVASASHVLLSDEKILELIGSRKMSPFLTLYGYTPQQIAVVTYNLVSPFIHTTDEQEERLKLDAIAQAFGSKVYGKALDADTWQLWLANRLYCISFLFDIPSSNIRQLRYSTISDPNYPVIDLSAPNRAVTHAGTLKSAVNSVRWDAYTSAVNAMSYALIRELVEGKVISYYQANRKRFTSLRKHLLLRMSAPANMPDTLAWQTLEVNARLSPYLLDAEDVTLRLALQLAAEVQAGEKPDYTWMGINAMIGYRHLARQLSDNVWLICAEGFDSNLEYQWDISTGRVTSFKYYRFVSPR